MIDLYTFTTPNGRKPAIMLEELGLSYTTHKIDIAKGEQSTPEFIAINPNGKIPAIIDSETGITVFESGAILIYLAEKTGRFMPTDLAGKTKVIEWVMFQMANVGSMMGQLNYFKHFATEKIPYAIERYEKETYRIFGVLDRQLKEQDYIAGDYSIADIATYPWIAAAAFVNVTLDNHPHLKRWAEILGERPAVQKGMAILQSSD